MLLHQNQRLSAVLNSIQRPECPGFNALKLLQAFGASAPSAPRTAPLAARDRIPPRFQISQRSPAGSGRRRRDARAGGCVLRRPPLGRSRRGLRASAAAVGTRAGGCGLSLRRRHTRQGAAGSAAAAVTRADVGLGRRRRDARRLRPPAGADPPAGLAASRGEIRGLRRRRWGGSRASAGGRTAEREFGTGVRRASRPARA